MSLQILLAEYPNYPARQVRGLAKQLQYLNGVNSKEAKGIAQDLQELHLLRAQVESRLNDDVAQSDVASRATKTLTHVPNIVPKIVADALYGEGRWEYVETAYDDRLNVQRTMVTPVSEAIRAIDHIRSSLKEDHGISATDDYHAIKAAKGMVHGSSFSTDYVTVRE